MGSAALFSGVSVKTACLGEVLRESTQFLNVDVDESVLG